VSTAASHWIKGLAVAYALLSAAPALAADDEAAPPPSCYDAQVVARIVRQTPSEFPDCGEGCIVMRWPWFMELDVEHVARGGVTQGWMKVLTVQHTYMRWDRPVRFWLRRNDLHGFNVVWDVDDARPRRCSSQDGRAQAYIHPGPGQTLGELEARGEREFGRKD
jgi:hypothetical protein